MTVTGRDGRWSSGLAMRVRGDNDHYRNHAVHSSMPPFDVADAWPMLPIDPCR